jgi:hypothetical protein
MHLIRIAAKTLTFGARVSKAKAFHISLEIQNNKQS